MNDLSVLLTYLLSIYEITLVNVHLNIHTHLRYAHKNGNGVINIAGDVMCRLTSIFYFLKVYNVQTSVKDF